VIEELFREVVILGGSISGEHGIGWVQKDYLPIALSRVELELMRKIKEVFDPNTIHFRQNTLFIVVKKCKLNN
jgi:glycolate oxidase